METHRQNPEEQNERKGKDGRRAGVSNVQLYVMIGSHCPTRFLFWCQLCWKPLNSTSVTKCIIVSHQQLILKNFLVARVTDLPFVQSYPVLTYGKKHSQSYCDFAACTCSLFRVSQLIQPMQHFITRRQFRQQNNSIIFASLSPAT